MEEILRFRGPGGSAADKGTAVHAVLEILANVKKAHQEGLGFYESKIGGKILTDLENIDIDHLINKVYKYYDETTQHNWKKADYRDVYNWTYVVLNHPTFSPLKQTIIDVEQYFKIELTEPDFQLPDGYLKITGKIDLITKIDEEELEITDYKTGKRQDWITGEIKDHDKLRNDLQLMIYYMAAKHLYPQYKNTMVTIYYIKDGGPISVHLDDDSIIKLKDKLKNRMREIHHDNLPQRKRSWRCKRFCNFAKMTANDFNPEIPVKQQFMRDQISNRGDKICCCDEANWKMQLLGIDKFVQQYKIKE